MRDFFMKRIHNTTQNCILENEDITMGIWFAKLTGHTVDASRLLKNPHVVASYALFFGFIGFILLVWISAFILTIVRICKKYSNARKHDETHRTVRKLSLSRFVNQTQCWLTKKTWFSSKEGLTLTFHWNLGGIPRNWEVREYFVVFTSLKFFNERKQQNIPTRNENNKKNLNKSINQSRTRTITTNSTPSPP